MEVHITSGKVRPVDVGLGFFRHGRRNCFMSRPCGLLQDGGDFIVQRSARLSPLIGFTAALATYHKLYISSEAVVRLSHSLYLEQELHEVALLNAAKTSYSDSNWGVGLWFQGACYLTPARRFWRHIGWGRDNGNGNFLKTKRFACGQASRSSTPFKAKIDLGR
jgi:hypothetical protein